MGLAAGQGTRMVIFEAVPVLLAAVTAGVICAWLLAPLTGSSLELSAFTDGAATVPVQADFTTLAIPPAGLVLLALTVLSVEAAVARRFGMRRRLHLDS